VATTLVAWLAAFLVITVLQRLFADQLASLPPELRALVLSGVLVGLMANVVMPAVSSVVVGADVPGRLIETLRMVPAGATHHLSRLEAAGLVIRKRRGPGSRPSAEAERGSSRLHEADASCPFPRPPLV
jgi:DNA-binding transcriptional ArsR family regulator